MFHCCKIKFLEDEDASDSSTVDRLWFWVCFFNGGSY